MKKLLVGLVILGSISTAMAEDCKIKGKIAGIDSSFSIEKDSMALIIRTSEGQINSYVKIRGEKAIQLVNLAFFNSYEIESLYAKQVGNICVVDRLQVINSKLL